MPTALALEPPRLTPQQIAQFHREGFLALQAITTPDDLALIREILDGLFERYDELPKDLVIDLGGPRHHAGTQRTPQVNLPSTLDGRLKESLYFRNATEVARQLLGEGVVANWDHAIYKPPHNGKATPWHQDLSYPARTGNHADMIRLGAHFWMPLQDASAESGCMQFIPHSHLGNLRPHHPAGNDPQVFTLETDGVDASKAAPCPIPAGGCTIHTPKTLHYTAPNDTDRPRRAYIINFSYPIPQ